MAKVNARAFTLLEVLMVIVILGLIIGLTMPDLFSAERAEQMPESAASMKSLVAMCRAQSMYESRRHRLRIGLDGSVEVHRQRDALEAPNEWVDVDAGWRQPSFLAPRVWVERVLAMPQGPPPILVEDDAIQFTQIDEEPALVQDLEAPVDVYFEPDGTAGSLRFFLRDLDGRGIQMTLDGRLGRVETVSAASIPVGDVKRPAKVEKPRPDKGQP